MEGFLQQFSHLKFELEEIKKATNNFDDQNNCIGGGGFGKVYKGELFVSHFGRRSMVAIKRLDSSHGQGEAEFMKEINTLSRYKHENLITLLGFCYQEDEMILVYQLASRGSLDELLRSGDLTWSKRIKICLDAAKGLRHLHDPRGTHQRLIHCDVKSSNILLDDHWNGKVADFGFSTMGPANELQSTVINLAAGTLGYCDPQYVKTNTLTKESDVYSFGVVLVEVLCGALCYTYRNGSGQHDLVSAWTECYEQKKLHDIIFKDPTIQPMDEIVLEIFCKIAYQCVKKSREHRPEMAVVVVELETALEIHKLLKNQEFIDNWNVQSVYYKEIMKTAEPPLSYRTETELMKFLFKGVLLNKGKTWFSLNKKGEHCEMISIAECLGSEFKAAAWPNKDSRFPEGVYYSNDGRFKTRVETQFLSRGITYTVNLVFKFINASNHEVGNYRPLFLKYNTEGDYLFLKNNIQGDSETSTSRLAYERDDGWWMAELCKFTCDNKIVHLQFLFEGFLYDLIEVEGIEFRPLEKVEQKEDDNQVEQVVPTEYEDIMKGSKGDLQHTTTEDAHAVMSKKLLIAVEGWQTTEKEVFIETHRKEIENTLGMVREEMTILTEVDEPGCLIDNYATLLNSVLSQKAASLLNLQRRLEKFGRRLRQQENLIRKSVPR